MGDEYEYGDSVTGGDETTTIGGPPPILRKEYSTIPLIAVSCFWLFVGVVIPFFVPKRNPNRRVTQCCLIMSAFCCWIFWFTVYVAQINPLFGPRMDNWTLLWISHTWGKPLADCVPGNATDTDGSGDGTDPGF